jgi:hypothetical protein
LLGGAVAWAADPLGEITRTIEGQARRDSSGLFDPETHQDAYHVAPGETVTLTEPRGPGEIRHMWFAIDGRGEGYYVGTVFSTQCSYGSRLGESDDRFYIDGESEPSIVGIGCENFFNDAWSLRLFSHANTGVTNKQPNGEDCRFTAYRWHIQAPVTQVLSR